MFLLNMVFMRITSIVFENFQIHLKMYFFVIFFFPGSLHLFLEVIKEYIEFALRDKKDEIKKGVDARKRLPVYFYTSLNEWRTSRIKGSPMLSHVLKI